MKVFSSFRLVTDESDAGHKILVAQVPLLLSRFW